MAWMLRLYNAAYNTADTVVGCGNELGLSLLVAESHDLNVTNSKNVQALSCDQAADMALLLAAGTKVELLNGNVVPRCERLSRLLVLRPEETKAKFTGQMIMYSNRWPDPALVRVALLHQFGYAAPHLKHVEIDVACALFTFGYSSSRPQASGEVRLSQYLYWRTHTHYAFEQSVKDRVLTVLLCLGAFVGDCRETFAQCCCSRRLEQ